jgi:hypothetical protein
MSAVSAVFQADLAAIDVRLGSLADMTPLNSDVRFTPESGHSRLRLECPLCAKRKLMNRASHVEL